MGPRWKGKGAEVRAQADPMSEIVSRLKSSLIESNAHGLLSGCSVLLAVEAVQSDLLNRACFGRPLVTAEKDRQWFQLSMEEAFYLCYTLKCLRIHGGDNCQKTDEELWEYMTDKKSTFPEFFKAYAHLRTKNWVVRSGSQYGVEYVAYRHHPSLVHSEYAVVVSTDGDSGENGRLRVWSDVHCTVRLCGSVAKALLVLNISKCGHGDASPSCVTLYSVEERVVARWSPKDCREDHSNAVNGD